MGTPAIFSQGSFIVDDSSTTTISDFDANSFRYEVESESLAMESTHVHAHGIRGTRSRASTRTRIGQKAVSGQVILYPTPVELDQWLPRILGAAESSDIFALAETLPPFSCLIDRVTKRFIYDGCYVDTATFSWSAGQMLKLTLGIEGKGETQSATSVPGTVPAINGAVPYCASDCTFALGADTSAAEISEVEITINNMLEKGRFMNSLTRAQMPALDREITVRVTVPYTADEVDLHDQAYTGSTGSVTFTLAGASTLFTFGNLKSPAKSPTFTSRNGEAMLQLNMTAFYVVGGARELVVTNDSTP